MKYTKYTNICTATIISEVTVQVVGSPVSCAIYFDRLSKMNPLRMVVGLYSITGQNQSYNWQTSYIWCIGIPSIWWQCHVRSSLLHRSNWLERSYSIRMFARPCVGLQQNVGLSTTNKRLDLDAPIFADIFSSTRYFRRPIFNRIINVLDLYFLGQRFESSTLESSYVNISQTVTYRTNTAIAKTKTHMWSFDWHIYIWPWSNVKVRDKIGHSSTGNVSQTVSDRANTEIANK